MQSLETKIPPPIVTVLFAFIMWLGSSIGPFLPLNRTVSTVLISLLLASGLFIGNMGVIAIKKAGTPGTPFDPEKTSSLVSDGVYRFTRNPMYLGSALALIAWAVYLSSVWVFIGVAGFILYTNHFQIIPEERALKKLFGSEFEDYQSKVRRWL